MKRLSTLTALVGSLVMAGAFGVACSKTSQRADSTLQRPLGQSTAMGPSDPSRPHPAPSETEPPPIERVPPISTPRGPAPTPTPATPTSSETPSPPSPSPTAPHTPNPLPAQPAPAEIPAPTPPTTGGPAPSLPPGMMPMQVGDAGVPPMRDAAPVTPPDAATGRADAGAAPAPTGPRGDAGAR